MISEAVLGGGCFWCLEAIFQELIGVEKVVSGYSGGSVENPSYEQVCTGETGHAEVVKISFDSEVISYKELLELFFTIHDPTTLNRQGGDVGTQYRSVIFFLNQDQKTTADEVIQEIKEKKLWDAKIVTEVVEMNDFYEAEEYNQGYFLNNPNLGYCHLIIEPKVTKFREKNFDRLKKIDLKL